MSRSHPLLNLRRRITPWIFGVLGLISTAEAQKAPKQPIGEDARMGELELVQLKFRRELLESCLNPLKSHISQLAQQSALAVELRDYETAIALRKERQRMELELDRIAKEMVLIESREKTSRTALLPEKILLPLDQARLSGVRYDPKRKVLHEWNREGGFAEWSLPDLPAGGYEVYLTYVCRANEGGSLLVSEPRFTLQVEMDTTLRGAERKQIGTLKITDGRGDLRLTALTLIRRNLMDLHQLELVPANR